MNQEGAIFAASSSLRSSRPPRLSLIAPTLSFAPLGSSAANTPARRRMCKGMKKDLKRWVADARPHIIANVISHCGIRECYGELRGLREEVRAGALPRRCGVPKGTVTTRSNSAARRARRQLLKSQEVDIKARGDVDKSRVVLKAVELKRKEIEALEALAVEVRAMKEGREQPS